MDETHADLVCESCGLVAETGIIDQGPEWRSFDDDAGRSRVGAPLTPILADRGLSTEVAKFDRDLHGRRLTEGQRALARRVRLWHQRAKSGKERSLAVGLAEVTRIAGALDLPMRVKERAAHLYRQAHSHDLIRGRSIDAIGAGVVLAACRSTGHLRTLKDLEKVARCTRREIGRAFALLGRELHLETVPESPVDHLPKLMSDLGLPHEVEREARALLQDPRAEPLCTSGKTAAGLAAAATYVASRRLGVPCTQSALSQAAKITEVTLRTRYKELVQRLEIRLPALV